MEKGEEYFFRGLVGLLYWIQIQACLRIQCSVARSGFSTEGSGISRLTSCRSLCFKRVTVFGNERGCEERQRVTLRRSLQQAGGKHQGVVVGKATSGRPFSS